MDTKVKIALTLAGISVGICAAGYIQQRYYWGQMKQAADKLSDIVDVNNKIVTDLAYAGIIKIQEPKDDNDGEEPSEV